MFEAQFKGQAPILKQRVDKWEAVQLANKLEEGREMTKAD
jgi:hypothetical protein